jgi:hypothetical protein
VIPRLIPELQSCRTAAIRSRARSGTASAGESGDRVSPFSVGCLPRPQGVHRGLGCGDAALEGEERLRTVLAGVEKRLHGGGVRDQARGRFAVDPCLHHLCCRVGVSGGDDERQFGRIGEDPRLYGYRLLPESGGLSRRGVPLSRKGKLVPGDGGIGEVYQLEGLCASRLRELPDRLPIGLPDGEEQPFLITVVSAATREGFLKIEVPVDGIVGELQGNLRTNHRDVLSRLICPGNSRGHPLGLPEEGSEILLLQEQDVLTGPGEDRIARPLVRRKRLGKRGRDGGEFGNDCIYGVDEDVTVSPCLEAITLE